jgi:CDGSH-type Zn-finger protein
MTKITCRPNGPYILEGEVELVDPAGARVDLAGRPKIALCRCGASAQKPFCDGAHGRVGFAAADPAPKPAAR